MLSAEASGCLENLARAACVQPAGSPSPSGSRWRRAHINIPDFSRRCYSFLTPIEIAPLRSFDSTPSSRSDLRYVPTLRTFLLYKCF